MEHNCNSITTVLVLDDDDSNRQLISNVLTSEGFEVHFLIPEKSLNLEIEEKAPGLIIINNKAAGNIGFDLITEMMTNEHIRNVPILMMIEMADMAGKMKYSKSIMVDYISKPLQIIDLVKRVNSLLTIYDLRKKSSTVYNDIDAGIKERTGALHKKIEELEVAKTAAEDSNKLTKHFLALISHELRTPITGILGYSEMLKDDLMETSSSEIVEGVLESSKRLKSTLDAVLNLSRIEMGNQKLNIKVMDIGSAVKSISERHSFYAKFKKIELNYNPSLEPIYAEADPMMLEIIINNLISNAIKFTDQGRVIVSVYKQMLDEEEWSLIKVEDSGIGIPKERLGSIFNEYQRSDDGLKRNFEGVGLGLAITKKYVEKLNGRIIVESDVSKGSVFYILLPSGQNDGKTKLVASGKEIKPDVVNTDGKNIRLLLVEDNQATIDVMKFFLKDGFRLEVVKEGAKALKRAWEEKFDIILMDINLGKGMTGVQATKEIRKIKEYKRTPIIAITAFAMPGDKEQFLKAGCTHYLAKPFEKRELLTIIENAVEFKR